ncbi:MAG: hypothetical protein IPK85_26810 [Gemmatimonadetes bacterium]|nr:hypothetical protein [Gemmatimonadota bacterium]
MWAWWLAATAGIVVTGAHWLAWRRSSSAVLPTARFVPAGARPQHVRRVALDEPLLWMLRLLVVGCLGAAVAPGLFQLPRSGRASILLVDATRAVGSASERTDSVTARLASRSRVELIAFDSGVRALAMSDLASLPRSDVAGALDVALVRAARRATELLTRVREVEIAVVSPVVEEEWTPAIPEIVRAAGVPVRWVRLAPASDGAPTDDPRGFGRVPALMTAPVAAVMNAVGRLPAGARLAAVPYTSDDSAFAAGGGVVVSFPEPQDAAPVRAILAGGAGAIGPWGLAPVSGGTPVAWWDDGTVAAAQTTIGRGCFRTVGVRVPVRGDDALRPSMAAVVRHLVQPCATARLTPVPAARLVGDAAPPGPKAAASDGTAHRRWWLALALVLLAVEWGVRVRRARMVS